MKRDLTEFTQVVQHDTACTIAATASVVKEKLATESSSGTTEKVRKGLSNFLGVISDTFAPSPDKTIDCDVITLMATPSGTTELYDSAKARLYSLQSDPATYCNEPDDCSFPNKGGGLALRSPCPLIRSCGGLVDVVFSPAGPPELFEDWLLHFSLEEKKGEISGLLGNSPSIRSLYSKMVPVAVSHSEFWLRYFYKVHQLEQVSVQKRQGFAQGGWVLPGSCGLGGGCLLACSLAPCPRLPAAPVSVADDCAPSLSSQEELRRDALKQRAEQSVHSEDPGWEEEEEEEFLGSFSSSSQAVIQAESSQPALPACPILAAEAVPTLEASVEMWAPLSPTPAEATPSESSESISLVTQIPNTTAGPASPLQTGAPLAGAGDDSRKLQEAGRDEQGSSLAKAGKPAQPSPPPQEAKASSEQPKERAESKSGSRTETLREDAPLDLRLFELNSDSGKSTPSNNGKKGSSTDISEDWEKDFDLDMTEEEVQMALAKVDISAAEMEDEEWEDWE
ncbi:BSD domain-containing protein 1 [Ophiophagus hannah]|uniref:BSD domain-containing protein 1 n=1 Tax=Ophiophagus hannah TaxID=8665 RepID=V8NW87_OPHHA|nr:BSD domain-containing protein 1 [Ophiophagus hannah]